MEFAGHCNPKLGRSDDSLCGLETMMKDDEKRQAMDEKRSKKETKPPGDEL